MAVTKVKRERDREREPRGSGPDNMGRVVPSLGGKRTSPTRHRPPYYDGTEKGKNGEEPPGKERHTDRSQKCWGPKNPKKLITEGYFLGFAGSLALSQRDKTAKRRARQRV